jgi:hypothetical protein
MKKRLFKCLAVIGAPVYGVSLLLFAFPAYLFFGYDLLSNGVTAYKNWLIS